MREVDNLTDAQPVTSEGLVRPSEHDCLGRSVPYDQDRQVAVRLAGIYAGGCISPHFAALQDNGCVYVAICGEGVQVAGGKHDLALCEALR